MSLHSGAGLKVNLQQVGTHLLKCSEQNVCASTRPSFKRIDCLTELQTNVKGATNADWYGIVERGHSNVSILSWLLKMKPGKLFVAHNIFSSATLTQCTKGDG